MYWLCPFCLPRTCTSQAARTATSTSSTPSTLWRSILNPSTDLVSLEVVVLPLDRTRTHSELRRGLGRQAHREVLEEQADLVAVLVAVPAPGQDVGQAIKLTNPGWPGCKGPSLGWAQMSLGPDWAQAQIGHGPKLDQARNWATNSQNLMTPARM